MATWKHTSAAASLKRPSVWRVPTIRRGMPAGSDTASTATGSGGAMAAPSAMAPAMEIPGTRISAVHATEATVRSTRRIESSMMIRHWVRIIAHDTRRASAHSSGGRKSGRMRSGSIFTAGIPGTNRVNAVSSVNSTGQGRLVRSPTDTTSTVANMRPMMTMRVSICSHAPLYKYLPIGTSIHAV